MKLLRSAPTTRRPRLLALGVITSATLVLTACAPAGGSPDAAAELPESLTIALSEAPDTLDPAGTGIVAAIQIQSQIFEPLMYQLNGSTEPIPGLAESMEVNDDATEYTFTLKQGVSFSDGTDFTAEAVKVSFDRVVDPATGAKSALSLIGPYEGTEVIDDYTVKVSFTQPYPSFAQAVTSAPLGISSPAAVAEFGASYGQHPTGTGPYVLESYTAGSEAVLKANPDYTWGPKEIFDGPAAIDELVYKVILDGGTQYNALVTNEIQVAQSLRAADISAAEDDGFSVLKIINSGIPQGYEFNTAKAPFDDVRVREAVSRLIDREAIVSTIFEDSFTVANGVVMEPTLGYVSGEDFYALDPERAEELLDEAGWKAGADGKRSKNGEPLVIDLLTVDFPFRLDAATLVQAQLGEYGITVNVAVEAYPGVLDSYKAGKSDTVDQAIATTRTTIMQAAFGCAAIGSTNYGNYCDPEIDALVEEANVSLDLGTRADLLSQAYTKIMEAYLYTPLWNTQKLNVSKVIQADEWVIAEGGYPLIGAIK